MSRLIALILLAILLFPLAALVYLVTFVVALEMQSSAGLFGSEETGFLTAGVLTWIFLAAYWLALWWKRVNWTPHRALLTLMSVGVAAVLAAVAGTMVGQVSDALGFFIGSVTCSLLWLVATIFIWRESAAERAARLDTSAPGGIVCPVCGYNLTGLQSMRCPECGNAFTIEQLMTSRSERDQCEVDV